MNRGFFLLTLAFAFATAAPVMAQTVQSAPAKGNANVGRVLSESCIGCHGRDGVSPVPGFPSLAGQKPQYLAKQLRIMRRVAKARSTGASDTNAGQYSAILRSNRDNDIMDPFVVGLSDSDIADIAAYFGSQKCGARTVATPIAAPKIAVRCRICHGEDGISKRSTIPNIAAQDKAYLISQLEAFRAAANNRISGPAGKQRYSKIMEPQAKLLSDQDIRELAEFYASQSCQG